MLRNFHSENPFRYLPILTAIISVACLAARLLLLGDADFNPQNQLFPTHLRLDSLFAGVCLSYHYFYKRLALIQLVRRCGLYLPLFGLGCMFPAFILPQSNDFILTFGLSGFYIGACCILIWMVLREKNDNSFVQIMAPIGRHSYSVYLWHAPVIVLANRFFQTPFNGFIWFSYVSFCIVLSLAVGGLISNLFEGPILKIRNNFLPSRA
jgi:peptidoglycan/LPS O-acetylase OafA/YrhL